MSFGLTAYTIFHVAISLVAILAGFIVAWEMLRARRADGWTALFLWTMVATSVTGFFFPVDHFMASHAVGIISLVMLFIAIYARYRRRLAGWSRPLYVVTAMISLYLNVFVLIVQLFGKVPVLKSLAPTQGEPPFRVTQLVVFLIFLLLTALAAFRFRKVPMVRK